MTVPYVPTYTSTFQDYTTYIGVIRASQDHNFFTFLLPLWPPCHVIQLYVPFVQYGTHLHTPRIFTLVAKTTMPTLVSRGVSLLYLPTTHLLGYNTSSRPYDIPSRLMVVLQIALGVARSSQFLCALSSVVQRVFADMRDPKTRHGWASDRSARFPPEEDKFIETPPPTTTSRARAYLF